MNLRDLLDKRARLTAQMREINERGDDGELSAEDQAQWDKLYEEAANLTETIQRETQIMEMEQRGGSERIPATMHQMQTAAEQARQGHADVVEELRINPVLAEYFNLRENEEAQIRARRQNFLFKQILPLWITDELRRMGADEYRALQQDLDVSGGYLVPPTQFVDDLIKTVDDMVFIRQWATTFMVSNADSLGVPTLENDPADADWTSELATGSEDSTMDFGMRELHPHPLAKRIKISRKLMRSVPSAESLVRDRLAYKFAITFEKGCLTGSGAGQPLGVFTASNDGISTSRDVSTDNTTTEIRIDGLKEAKYTLKPQYWPRARWLFHRDAVKQIAKLKDGEGQYYWAESVRVGEPDRLLGLPTFMSEYAPNTFTTGQYVGILGDFSQYWIADALTMEFQLLQELYAATNQVGLIGRMESDGAPVLEEAFVRVKLA